MLYYKYFLIKGKIEFIFQKPTVYMARQLQMSLTKAFQTIDPLLSVSSSFQLLQCM